MRNAVTGRVVTASTNTATASTGRFGKTVRHVSGGGLYRFQFPRAIPVGGAYTLLALTRWNEGPNVVARLAPTSASASWVAALTTDYPDVLGLTHYGGGEVITTASVTGSSTGRVVAVGYNGADTFVSAVGRHATKSSVATLDRAVDSLDLILSWDTQGVVPESTVFAVWDRALAGSASTQELRSALDNPWQLFSPAPRPVYFVVSGPANDITGQLTAGTLAALTSSAAARVEIQGAASTTLGALTSSAAGALAIVGQLTTTLATATSSSAATLQLAGQLASTLGAATSASSGAVQIAGQLAATLDAATGASAGTLQLAGQLTATLESVAGASAGTLPIAGALAGTLGAASAASSGTLQITGDLARTLESVSGTAAAGLRIAGTLDAGQLEELTSTAGSSTALQGAADLTLSGLSITATGVLQVLGSGQLAATLDALTGAADGALQLAGELSGTLDGVSIAAVGELQGQRAGDVASTLGSLAATATATLAIAGAASHELASLTSSAAGSLAIRSDVSATLGQVSSSSAGALRISGELVKQLDALTSATAALVDINATLAATLGLLVVESQGLTIAYQAPAYRQASVRGQAQAATVSGGRSVTVTAGSRKVH